MSKITTLFYFIFILPCLAFSFPFDELKNKTHEKDNIIEYLLEINNQYKNHQQYNLNSIKTLMSIIGMSHENSDILNTINKYYFIEYELTQKLINLPIYNIELIQEKEDAYKSQLIKKNNAYKWTNTIIEFKGLAKLIFSFMSTEEQNIHRSQFNQSIEVLDTLHNDIKSIVLAAHPGLNTINIKSLQNSSKGTNVTIAVFDVFEENLLAIQRENYNQTKIETTKKFGDPVSLSHGNAVIDIILSIAPRVKIIPINSDIKNYNTALQYILSRKDITIVNMSRAFLEKNGELDPDFKKLIINLSKQAIITKSLGNCGTDLFGNLSPIRKRLGLGKVGAISCYDTKLINNILTDPIANKSQHNMLYAINVNPYANETALTATVPGDLSLAQLHSLSVPAEGIYTPITDNFESGSSFAAPQLAAVASLLYQAAMKQYPYQYKQFHLHLTAQAIKHGVNSNKVSSNEFGLGVLDGDQALKLIIGDPE